MDIVMILFIGALCCAGYFQWQNTVLRRREKMAHALLDFFKTVLMQSAKMHDELIRDFEEAVMEGTESDEANNIRRSMMMYQKSQAVVKKLMDKNVDKQELVADLEALCKDLEKVDKENPKRNTKTRH